MQQILLSSINFILPLHIGILLITIWNIFHADHLGFKWMRGVLPKLDATILAKYHNRVFAGLLGMIVTGVLLFIPRKEILTTSLPFMIKMAMVTALMINSVVIFFLMKRTTTNTFAELTWAQRIPLFLSGAVSTIGWISAAIAATMLPE